MAREVAKRMAEAAEAWLDSLDPPQRAVGAASAPRPDGDDERVRWFYTPTDHGGLTLHEQRPAQQRLAMQLVATGLSEAGYGTVATVLGLENVLDRVEGFTATFGRERGRDPGMYYMRVFGEPGGRGAWGWRFGGHHVSLNNLVVDGQVAATTPCFLGADPAASPLLGGTQLRPLGAVEDLGRELVRSLRPELAERALLLPRAPSDIVTANRSWIDAPTGSAGPVRRGVIWRGGADPREPGAARDDRAPLTGLDGDEYAAVAITGAPKGVPGRELDAEQREILHALLATYLDRAPAGVSPLPRYTDPAELDAVHFAWAGSTAPGEPHYYRLHGPRLLVEWDNTQRDVNHAHSVWRDPEGDFGRDALAAHRAGHHA
jgi:Protein of unknown function (DUF3500)